MEDIFIKACLKGDKNKIESLIPCININFKNNQGFTPLMVSCFSNKTEITQLLIENGALTNIQDFLGISPLMISKNLETTKLLIDNGANIFIKDNTGKNILMYNCINSQTNVFNFFLEKCDINDQDNFGNTALMFSCINNNIFFVKCLLEKGANTSFVNILNENVLIKSYDNDCIKYFLNMDLEMKNKDNDTVLMLACKANNEKNVRMLLEKGADISFPFSIIPSYNIFDILFEYGYNINSIDENGKTILIHACSKNDLQIIKYIIKKGINLDIQDNKGLTSLTHSIIQKNIEIVKLLLDCGANPNIESYNINYNNLFYCINWDLINIFKVLISNPLININAKSIHGITPLMYAIMNRKTSFALEIIDYSEDLNITSFDGNTALLYSIKNKNFEVTKKLLERKVDIFIYNLKGENALSIADTKTINLLENFFYSD